MLIGADPEELERLAEQLKLGSKQMTSAANSVTSALSRVRWTGRDADEFRRRWSNSHRPFVHRVADDMATMGRNIRAEARDQRITSDGGIVGGVAAVGATVVGGAGVGAVVGGGSGGGGGGGGGGAIKVDGNVKVSHTKVDNTHKKVSGAKEWVKGPDGKYHAVEKQESGKAPSRTKVSGDVSTTVASDHREAVIGAHGSKSGEYHGAVDAKGSVEATAGIKATNDASIKVGKDGVTATSEGRVMAGVEVAAQGEIGKGPVKVSGGASAMAGAEASYNAKAQIGLQGVGIEGGADAFVGGRAAVDGNVNVGGVKVGGGAGVEYGIGAGAKGGINFNSKKIGISGDVHVSLGLGVQLKLDVSVDPSEVLDNAGKAANFAGGVGKKVIEHLPIKKFW